MEFGKILRKKRENKGYTQEEVAQRLGISKQNVCSFEKGYKIPSLMIAVAAADLFGCSMDEMIGRVVS